MKACGIQYQHPSEQIKSIKKEALKRKPTRANAEKKKTNFARVLILCLTLTLAKEALLCAVLERVSIL